MTDHLFPESTTYVHSYPGHEGYFGREPYHAPESRPFVFVDPDTLKRTRPDVAIDHDQAQASSEEAPRCGVREPKPKKKPVCSSLGYVELSELPPAQREFFLVQTYRTTYGDYARAGSGSLVKKPFTRQDDVMLQVLNSAKPNLAYYGFGLPNKCSIAWGTVQSRTLPREGRSYVTAKKAPVNPFPGYPEKMYPYILSKELCPHYDGSFVHGYTGHQRHCLDYPEDVNAILRRDFPQYVPRALTTNQAMLAYLPIPWCENKNNTAKDTENPLQSPQVQ